MAVLANKFVDLIDVYKATDGMGAIVEVIEMLSEMNPILDDALAMECNSGANHKHTVRTGLPSVSWGRLYKGIDQSKSQRAQVEDTTGFVEGMSTIDKRLLDLSTNEGALRLQEAMSYLEAMSQEVAEKIFYGNSSEDPEEFMGFAPRFNDKSAPNGKQIIDAGGTGNALTSIWFITWGPNQCCMLYPKGTQAGIMREDMGEQRLTDDQGNPFYGKEEQFTWHVGLAVKDWRYIARIANIDVAAAEQGSVDIYAFLRKGYYRIWNRRVAQGQLVIYMNREMLEVLDTLAHNAGADDNFTRLKPMEVEGKEVMTYRGIPIRESDSLINTESQVT